MLVFWDLPLHHKMLQLKNCCKRFSISHFMVLSIKLCSYVKYTLPHCRWFTTSLSVKPRSSMERSSAPTLKCELGMHISILFKHLIRNNDINEFNGTVNDAFNLFIWGLYRYIRPHMSKCVYWKSLVAARGCQLVRYKYA